MSSANVEHIFECFIKPKYEVEESKQPYYLAPNDLSMLCFHYIQKGLMFSKPSHVNGVEFSIHKFVGSLKDSLSLALVHFYPLAGQLVTQVDEEQHESLIFVDCNKGNGAKFIHATLDMTICDIILSPNYIPEVIYSFFDHHKAVNHDGHFLPLLSVQVTELLDGVFIGCSMNHAVSDGTSYWQFWNVWSDIHRANGDQVSASCRPRPVHNRWYPDGYGPVVTLPFTQPCEFVTRYEEAQNTAKMFHFTSESVARLKAKACEESNDNKISSLQALSSLVWRAIVRANCLSHDTVTSCTLLANNRNRLNPALPQHYFGNYIHGIDSKVTVSALLEHNLGWAASLLHQTVEKHNDKVVRDQVTSWLQSPFVSQVATLFDTNKVAVSHSPRFNIYGNEFGLGKAVAVRSGYACKFGGLVVAYAGYEAGGSIDLEICLPPVSMRALESDEEFSTFVWSPSTRSYKKDTK